MYIKFGNIGKMKKDAFAIKAKSLKKKWPGKFKKEIGLNKVKQT